MSLFYSTSQFEAQLRLWGIRKNWKRREWEEAFQQNDESCEIAITPGLPEKSRDTIKRARRWVRRDHVTKECDPTPASSRGTIGGSSVEGVSEVALGRPHELGWLSDLSGDLATLTPATVPTDPEGASEHTISQAATSNPFARFDGYNQLESNSSELNDGGFPLVFTALSPSHNFDPFLDPGFQEQHETLEGPAFTDTELSPWNDEFLCGWLEPRLVELPFTKFEEDLRSRGTNLISRDPMSRGIPETSLSNSFSLAFIAEVVRLRRQSISRPTFDLQSIFQKLGTLLPGENTTAVMTGEQMLESNFVRILLFSALNGFAGLNDIPVDDILRCLSHLRIMNSFLLRILKERSRCTSTLATNIFRAAIEAKDERVVKLLLEHQLVDVNDTVCSFRGSKYTPVERAACLKALNLIRILVRFGADTNKTFPARDSGGALSRVVNKTFLARDSGGALSRLIESIAFTSVRATEYIETVDILIKAGARVKANIFSSLDRATRHVAHRLPFAILPSDHHAFFGAPLIQVATHLDDSYATAIILNMNEICEKSGCGDCLRSSTENVERALFAGAKRGHFQLVQLLISHAKSLREIFIGAIMSDKRDLIELVLARGPELDPPALCLYYFITTPLAEAVRAGNKDLINHLEVAGALENLDQGGRFRALIGAVAQAGNASYMKGLLSRGSSSIQPQRASGSALQLAIENGYEEISWMLLEAGATVDCDYEEADIAFQSVQYPGTSHGITEGFFGKPPLYAAIKRRNAAMVRAILHADATIMTITHDVWSEALKWGDPDILSDLIFMFPDTSSSHYDNTLHHFCRHQCGYQYQRILTDANGCPFGPFGHFLSRRF
jgi:hypothetical protein